MKSNTTKADFLLFIVTLLAAVSWMFSKEAVLLMPPLLFVAIRFLLAGGLLAALGFRQLQGMTKNQYQQAIKVGLVFGAAMSCWIMGLHFGEHIGEGAFLTSLGVVLVPLITLLLYREPSPRSTWFALPIAVFGLALLSLQGHFKLEIGQLFYLMAAIIFALFYAMNTRAATRWLITRIQNKAIYSEKVPALALTAVTLLCVGIVAGILSFLMEPWQEAANNYTSELGAWIIASALIGTALRFLLQTYAQSLSTHSHGVVILTGEPVFTATIAAFWFDESMRSTQIMGCMLILIALLVARWPAIRSLFK